MKRTRKLKAKQTSRMVARRVERWFFERYCQPLKDASVLFTGEIGRIEGFTTITS